MMDFFANKKTEKSDSPETTSVDTTETLLYGQEAYLNKIKERLLLRFGSEHFNITFRNDIKANDLFTISKFNTSNQKK